jgi:hypothetical protein
MANDWKNISASSIEVIQASLHPSNKPGAACDHHAITQDQQHCKHSGS